MRRAVFLDRDGVLNRLVGRNGSGVAPRTLREFTLLPGVSAAAAALARAGLIVIVTTNQPELARGTLAPRELARMHARLRREVAVDAIYTCPHDDADDCRCRKPRPGLLERASLDWDIELAASYLVGDSWKDIAAGQAAGCATILVAGQGAAELAPEFVAQDLPAAAALILAELGRPRSHAAARAHHP